MSARPPEDQPSVDDFEFILAEDLKKQAPQDEPTNPDNPRPRKKSLAERATVKKKLSAMEALQLMEQQAREEEERKRKAELARKLAEEAVKRVALQKQIARQERERQEAEEAEDEAEWARAMFGSSTGPKVPVAGKVAVPASALPAADRPEPPPPEPEPEVETPVSPRRSRAPSRSLLGSASRRSLAPAPVEPTPEPPPPEPVPPRPVERSVLEQLPDGAEIRAGWDAIPAGRMAALMRSHHSRASHEGDLALALALGEVVRLLDEGPERLSAARVHFHGEDWAVWMDGGRLIGAFLPAELYLLGL